MLAFKILMHSWKLGEGQKRGRLTWCLLHCQWFTQPQRWPVGAHTASLSSGIAGGVGGLQRYPCTPMPFLYSLTFYRCPSSKLPCIWEIILPDVKYFGTAVHKAMSDIVRHCFGKYGPQGTSCLGGRRKRKQCANVRKMAAVQPHWPPDVPEDSMMSSPALPAGKFPLSLPQLFL